MVAWVIVVLAPLGTGKYIWFCQWIVQNWHGNLRTLAAPPTPRSFQMALISALNPNLRGQKPIHSCYDITFSLSMISFIWLIIF